MSSAPHPSARLPVILVGLPGAGKSSIGRRLAMRLKVPFLDTDAVIEERIGGTIREFFEREGEEHFRELEQAVLAELVAGHRGVLATGGGIVLREANRRAMREGGQVVYLHCSPESLHHRLRNDTKRPLLQVADPLAKLNELYGARDAFYRETAHHQVDTGSASLPALVRMLAARIEGRSKGRAAGRPARHEAGQTQGGGPS